MPRNGEVAPADTAHRILRAAAALMTDRGFEGTSMQEVADRAGVNKALVFYHFGNKAKLFERVLEACLSGLHERLLAEHDEGPASPEVRLHRILDAYMDFIEANPSFPRLVQLELASGGGRHDLIAEANRQNFELILPLIAALTGDTDGPTAPHQLFTSFVGMVLYYFINEPTLRPLIADPLGPAAQATRRRHVHWMVEATLERLRSER